MDLIIEQGVVIDRFPLSPMQQGMLFHYLKEPRSGVDIEQLVIHCSEAIDPKRLRGAWEWLLERHDILRARFVWEGVDSPEQEILKKVELPIAFLDLRREEHPEKEFEAFLREDRTRGFEMASAPLLRLTLCQWAEARFSVVWTFHHALLDGRSYVPLLREVFEAYAELAQGEIAERAKPLAYRRYIEWLQEYRPAGAEGFWKQLLEGFSAPTPLVVDQPIREGAYRQGEIWESLDASTAAKLRGVAASGDLTMNTLVMGAWAILLHRYSGEPDIVFGATRACRKSSIEGAEDTVGLFINTVPVRVRLQESDTVLSVLKGLRRQWLDVRAYEHTPLARLKSISQVPAAQPLFESLLVFENYRLDEAVQALGGEWSNRRIELRELTNFPVTLAAYDGSELSFKIEFDRRRLTGEAVRRMLGHLRYLLEQISAQPEITVGELALLTDRERRELVEEFNSPAPSIAQSHIASEATLHELFEAQAAQRPNATAVSYDGKAVTYAELNARANRVARTLASYGVQRESLVGICLNRTDALIVAILAVLKAGGAYLPIDLAYPAERLAFMLEDAMAPVLLTESSLRAQLPNTSAKLLFLDELLAEAVDAEDEGNLPASSRADDLAYVIYTSGTTGKPKGSLITHRNVVRLFSQTEAWYRFDYTDVWTLFHSCAFDFSVWEIWGALIYGGRLVVVPFLVSRSPEAFYELLVNEQVTVLNQTPSAFRQLIQAEETGGQKPLSLRYVVFGGEALEMQSLKPWFDRHGDSKPQLVNMYGITETTVHVTYRPLTRNDLLSGSVIGIPIPDLQIYILDPQRRPVPIGVPGEMYVGGAGLARGYLHRPELTDARFIPDHLSGRASGRLYRTGDLARFLPGFDIEYLGRIDDQVKIRGFRIELGEIESVLCQHSAIREARVIAQEDTPGTKRLIAYLVAQGPPPDVSALREHLKRSVPDYMVPAAFAFLEKFPLTTNGKIDVKALPAPEKRPTLSNQYIAPATKVDKVLAAIWAKVLRLERVGIRDNFFELGGDSILSIQLISLARRKGVKLTPQLLFAHQTIAELAAVAQMADDETAEPDVAAGDVPLTPVQRWFFEQNLDNLHYYNQAFFFETTERLDSLLLESALDAVYRHHDALRLRFVRTGSGWSQSYEHAGKAPLRWVAVDHLSESERAERLESVAASAQASLNVEKGPLWSAVYFDFGFNEPGRLLLVIHHLVVDGVSWRPLLEDLETAYMQLKSGADVALPPKTSSFKKWAERLVEYASSVALQTETDYWKSAVAAVGAAQRLVPSDENLEETAEEYRISLTAHETRTLLQDVPPVYNTQINDLLLTALAKAWSCWSDGAALVTNLEGHGREPLFQDVDLSRTAGWFTSIFPVRVELPPAQADWEPGQALKLVKEQLRRIPRRGIGYGILRYLRQDPDLSAGQDPSIVFNYLGQLDHALAGSHLFRFSRLRTGASHAPKQRRRHVIEVNGAVLNGRLEVTWTYPRKLQDGRSVAQLASEFAASLKTLIAHCQSPEAGGRTPSDFPLADLNQETVDALVGTSRNVEDICPLSPIQTLFFSANPGSSLSAFDHWHCTLTGDLDVALFQAAWKETLQRHTLLRTAIHSEALRQPLQVVHREVTVRWVVEDWRSLEPERAAERWQALLAEDRKKPINLTLAPAMRFALIRLGDQTWKLLWSVPALLLDGWSWPVVFGDVSRLYAASSRGKVPEMAATRPYRAYLEWLQAQPTSQARQFWQSALEGITEPTPLAGKPQETSGKEGYGEQVVELRPEISGVLKETARQLQVTVNTLIQAVWALVLGSESGTSDVVFGAAFSGRSADLPGADMIVGPFVNNLPVRVRLRPELSAGELLKGLHKQLLEMSPFQFLPLVEIQRCSSVPWRYRLFDSVVVFQNYLVDEAARRFGDGVAISEFIGPIHNTFPLMLVVDPNDSFRLSLLYDRQLIPEVSASRWGRNLRVLLERISEVLDQPLSQLMMLLAADTKSVRGKPRLRSQSLETVLPQTKMEMTIAAVWQKLFELEQVSVDDNLFELGGHSLLLVQMHKELQSILGVDFPIVVFFEHPTIRSLAQRLDSTASTTSQDDKGWRHRAERQKEALTRLRGKLKR